MSLQYEPSSEPLHISVKYLFIENPPICLNGSAYHRMLWISLHGLFNEPLCSPLCGETIGKEASMDTKFGRCYRGSSLMRKRHPPGPYCRHMLGPYGGPRGGAVSYERGTPVAGRACGSQTQIMQTVHIRIPTIRSGWLVPRRARI